MKEFFLKPEVIAIGIGVIFTLLFGRFASVFILALYYVAQREDVNACLAKHVGTTPTKPPKT